MCFGPGDTALCVFPRNNELLCLDDSREMTDGTDLSWTLQVICQTPQPFVLQRHTPLENVLTIPGMNSRVVAVSGNCMRQLRHQYAELLTFPTNSILGIGNHVNATTLSSTPFSRMENTEVEKQDDDDDDNDDDENNDDDIYDEEFEDEDL